MVSYRIGVSTGIALKGRAKRVQHNESLTVGCIELNLLSIRIIESQLYVYHIYAYTYICYI